MEWSWFGDVDVRLISLDLDFSVRCHWLASWLPMGLAFSTLVMCFMSASPNLSTHAYITSCTIFFFLPSLKRLFQKMTKLFCGLHRFWNQSGKLRKFCRISVFVHICFWVGFFLYSHSLNHTFIFKWDGVDYKLNLPRYFPHGCFIYAHKYIFCILSH